MLAVRSLLVRGFRNLAAQELELHPRFNVLYGENGQGKTNTIEALYLATTSRSFRTSALQDCLSHGEEASRVKVAVDDERDVGASSREQIVDLKASAQGSARRVLLSGKRPKSMATFALATPIVLFEPASLTLTQGGASERRRLLDRVGAHLLASSGGAEALLRDATRYRRALLHRKRALAQGAGARVLEPFERIMAEHGISMMQARQRATDALVGEALVAFSSIAQTHLELSIAYAPRAPTDFDGFVAALAQRRDDDARRGTATIGPHLDDLRVFLGGRPARQVASQGQHRAIVLALKGAELASIARARHVPPILLLDDVSSELDPKRSQALFQFLSAQVGQVVLTTTRPDLIPIDRDRALFEVDQGVVRARR